ncbi:MAG TPA: DUF3048 domain-containing protein [Acidimicrobiales bacterium]|nr:DUF3048 domain-containing protein [Acidimicrobiales bacterium]
MRRSLVLVLAIATCSNVAMASSALAGSSTTTTSTGSVSTSTTTPPVKKTRPVAPLTGLADPRGVTKHRSALTIKIDNTPEAYPHSGVEDADVVYEEIVEGGITRLAAIFNSRVPTVVGPVRSVRRTDREIVFPIGGIFAFSGGAEYAVRSIATAPVKLYTESNSGSAMFRDPKRYPPHNLFANAALLMAKDGKPRPPPALFTFASRSQRLRGPRVRSFVVGFTEGYAVTYTWNTTSRSWDRTIFGQPDVTTNGVRISPKNVIVMSVNYVGGVGVIDSYAQLIGSGPVEVFNQGTLQRGTWSRPNLRSRTIYKNASGKVIDLTPGQTWVELLDVSEHVSITSAST